MAAVTNLQTLLSQEVDPDSDTGELARLGEAAGGLLTELAGALPGIDEAMSFAEVIKQVWGDSTTVC